MVFASSVVPVLAGAAVTGATAVLVGLLGYLGTRHSVDATVRQAELDADRGRAQRLDDARERRAGFYRDLVATERRLWALDLFPEPMSAEAFAEWYEEWHRVTTPVLLHGTVEVCAAVQDLSEIFTDIWIKNVAGTPYDQLPDRLRVGLRTISARRVAAVGRLLDAMRADTAASQVEISAGTEA